MCDKQPWEMTREEAWQVAHDSIEHHPDYPPPLPEEYHVLNALVGKLSKKYYDESMLTEEAMSNLHRLGYCAYRRKKLHITPEGHSALWDFNFDNRKRDLVYGGLADEVIDTAMDIHENAVRQAIQEGIPVPPEVLADYPHLQPKKESTS